MKYLVRFITYIAGKAVVILIVAAIMVTAFTCAMNLSNMFVVLSDGMELRANVALGKSDGDELPKYFYQQFLEEDEVLCDSEYRKYKITSSSYSLDIDRLWAWPWQTRTTAVVKERVRLEGNLLPAYQNEEQLASSEKFPAPAWENHVYNVHMRKLNGSTWIIEGMDVVEELPEATLRPSSVE